MSVYYPTEGDAIAVNAMFIDAPVRDIGLLGSAIGRPQASMFGQDAYPDLWSKAAALLHSMVSNHPFIDANKRTALALTVAMLARNGVDITQARDDELFDLVMTVANKGMDDVADIASALRGAFALGPV